MKGGSWIDAIYPPNPYTHFARKRLLDPLRVQSYGSFKNVDPKQEIFKIVKSTFCMELRGNEGLSGSFQLLTEEN